MSDRKAEIRKFVVEKHAESWAVLSRLGAGVWGRRVYSEEGSNWTVRDLLAHLADAEAGQLAQIRRLLAGQQTLPADFDLDRWNRSVVAKRADLTPADHLAAIQSSYEQGLALLDEIAEAKLDRVGRHARGDDISIERFFRRMAAHRAMHAEQVQRALVR